MPVADELTRWTEIGAIGTLALAAATVLAVGVTIWLAVTDRRRDDARRKDDHDREDQLRRDADEKWEQRLRDEQRQREDDDAQQQVVVEFLSGGPLSQAQQTVTTGDGITHRIVVTAPAAYPIKWLGAEIAHRSNSGLGIFSPGWGFQGPVTENGQVRYTCNARVPQTVHDAAPIVRFTDRNGNLYYRYLGYTGRFRQNTDYTGAAQEIDQWIRTGPKPDQP